MNIRLIFGALLGAALLSGMALVGPLTREARGDFILWDSQQMTVNTTHSQGSLYDTSRAFIVSGGQVSGRLSTYDSSVVDISGGSVNFLDAWNTNTVNISGGSVNNLTAYETSTVNVNISGGSVYDLSFYGSGTVDISGGSVSNYLFIHETSTVNISGGSVEFYMHVYDGGTVDISAGSVNHLDTHHNGTVDISGGSVNHLYAGGTSVITFHARDFRTHGGLWLDGDRVLGTGGALTGEWFDGTSWAVDIPDNQATATILVIPEPATLLLLAMGGLALLRRRRVAPQKDRP